MSRRIAFILGAGAHIPFGFPSGEDLKLEVAKLIGEAKKEVGTKQHGARYDGCANGLLGCGTSIDKFLSENKDHDEIIRPLIAKALSWKEMAVIQSQYISDWLKYLWPYIAIKKGQLDKRFSFVTFNYDRTTEFMLARACAALWGMPYDECAKLVEDSLTFYHVYGSFGSIAEGSPKYFPYGVLDCEDVAGKRIKIIGEHDETTTQAVHKVIKDVDAIYMLGCAFHKENMSLLSLNTIGRTATASCYGFTGAEIESLTRMFPYLRLPNEQWKCIDLLRNHKQFQALLTAGDAPEPKIPAVHISGGE